MSKVRLTLAATFVAVSSLGFSSAWAADWRLVEVSGVVRVARPGQDAAPAAVNQILPAGSTVTTVAGGRAALYNGAQRITLAPNSRMTVTPESASGMTRVMQDLGSILFQVDKKPAQHFRVETPLLAAVVKGTTFTVSVDMQMASVHVAEGLVEVRANHGDAVQDVVPGATGAVSREAPGQISLMTPAAEPVGVAPVSAPALDYKQVSNGLVDGPAAPIGGAAAVAALARAATPGSADAMDKGPVSEAPEANRNGSGGAGVSDARGAGNAVANGNAGGQGASGPSDPGANGASNTKGAGSSHASEQPGAGGDGDGANSGHPTVGGGDANEGGGSPAGVGAGGDGVARGDHIPAVGNGNGNGNGNGDGVAGGDHVPAGGNGNGNAGGGAPAGVGANNSGNGNGDGGGVAGGDHVPAGGNANGDGAVGGDPGPTGGNGAETAGGAPAGVGAGAGGNGNGAGDAGGGAPAGAGTGGAANGDGAAGANGAGNGHGAPGGR